MAARARRVVWAESASVALGQVLGDIAEDSPSGAARVLTQALKSAESLAIFADRGRIVPEVGHEAVRELFVFSYRLLYRVHPDRVVIVAFLHGARDFAKWRQEERPDL